MRFEWDEAKRLQNLKDHGVDFVDARKVFAGPTFTFEDDRLSGSLLSGCSTGYRYR